MKPRLYVHIGHGKTASSTLQRALQVNADTIRSHGLLISDHRLEFPRTGSIKGYPILVLEEMMWRLLPEQSEQRMNACLERLCADLSDGGFHGAVISSENLANERASRLFRNASRRFDLHVLHLIRRQDEWLESSWKQWGMKSGATLPEYVEGQLAAGRPAFLAAARRWQAIGAEMRVVPLHAITDIPALLFDWLGINDCSPEAVPRLNETLDYSVLEILSQNPFLFSSSHDNTIFNMLDALLPETAPRVGYGLLPEELRARIMAHFKEENAILHRDFFPALKPLDRYRPRAKPAPSEPDPAESFKRYLGINLLLINSLKERIDEASKKNKEDSHELKEALKDLIKRQRDDRALLTELASTFPMSLLLSIRRALRRMRRRTRQPTR